MAGDLTNWITSFFQQPKVPDWMGMGVQAGPNYGNLVPSNSLVPPDIPTSATQAALGALPQTLPPDAFLSPGTTSKLNDATPLMLAQLRQGLTSPITKQYAPAGPTQRPPMQANQPTAAGQMQALQELMRRYGLG